MKMKGKKRKKKEEMLVIEDPVVVLDPQIIGAFGGTCVVCGLPANGVIAGHADWEFLPCGEIEYSDPGMQAAAERIRAHFNTNVEFPVCESHRYGALSS